MFKKYYCVKQHDITDCGAACLATISNLYCPYNGYMFMSFDGNIYPCCSHCVIATGLSIGNYKNINFPDTINLIKKMLYILKNYGFDFL